MRPAEGERSGQGVRTRLSGHGLVSLIAVAVDDAAIALEQPQAMNGPTARCIGVNHARWVRSGPGPVIARERPEVAGFGPAAPGIQHRRRGLIDTELRRGEQKLAQTMPQGLQFLGRIADPEGERGTVDGNTVRRQHLRLAVKRQMPMILGIDHMRDEPLGRQSSPDQSLGSSMLEDDAVTGAAGQFGAAGDDDAILRRYDVQPLALIVTDLKKVACAARAAGCSGHQGLDDARQMLRQLATIGPALGSSLLACFGIGAVLGCFESRDSLIDILQNKLELISVKLFRRSTELRVFCKLEQPLEPGAAIQQSRGKGTQLGWIARQFIRQITHWPSLPCFAPRCSEDFMSYASAFGCGIRGACMRVQSMPARSADNCAAFIRMTPSTTGGHLKALPS